MPLAKQPKFSLRNVTCDHYMVLPNASLDPTSSHDHRSVNRVPVIRVFGILDSGQKCCLHVHGVLPYIMLECQAEVDGAFADQFADALDTALNMAISQRPNANGRPTGPHVHRIKVVKGLPFYGYYCKKKTFLKVSLYNPTFLKLTVELVQRGAIMQTVFQPFEAHVPYILKFFLDYSIYGMDYVHLTAVKFRVNTDDARARDDSRDSPSSVGYWKIEEIMNDPDLLSPLEPVSTLELEADCLAIDILNKDLAADSKVQNPGLDVIWRDERQRCTARRERLEDYIPTSQERPVNEAEMTGADAHFRDKFERLVDEMQTVTNTPSSSLSVMMNNSIVDEQVVMDITHNTALFANAASSQDSFMDILAELQAQGDVQFDAADAKGQSNQSAVARTPSTFHDDQRIDAGPADTSLEEGDEGGQAILDELEMTQQLISFRIDDERSGDESDSFNDSDRLLGLDVSPSSPGMSNCSPGVSSYRPPRQVATAVLHGSRKKRTAKDPKPRSDSRSSKHRKLADNCLDDDDDDNVDSVAAPLRRSSFSRTIRISSDDQQQVAPSAVADWLAAAEPDAPPESCSNREDDLVDDAMSDNLLFESTPPPPPPPIIDSSTPLAVKIEPLDLHFNLTDQSDSDSDDSICILDPNDTMTSLNKTFDVESDANEGEPEGAGELKKRRRKRKEQEDKEEKAKSSGSDTPAVVEFDLEDAVDRPLCLDDVHLRVCRAEERRARRTFHLGGQTVTAQMVESDDCSGFGREQLLLDPIPPNVLDRYSSPSHIASPRRSSSANRNQQKAKRSKPFNTAPSSLTPKSTTSKSITSNYDNNDDDDEDEFVSLAPMLSGELNPNDSLNSGQTADIDDTCKQMEVENESAENLNESGILNNQREREERAEESQRLLTSRDTPDVLLETDDLRPARPEVTELWQWPTVAPPDPSEVRSWVATHQGARQRPAANFNSQGGETEDEQSGGSQSLETAVMRKSRALRTNRRVARRQGPRAVDLEKNPRPLRQLPEVAQPPELFNHLSATAIPDDCDSTSFGMNLFLEEDSATESEIVMPQCDQPSQHLTIHETRAAYCADDSALTKKNLNNRDNLKSHGPANLMEFGKQQPAKEKHAADSGTESFGVASGGGLVEARRVENEQLNRGTKTALLFSDESSREKESENVPYKLQQSLLQFTAASGQPLPTMSLSGSSGTRSADSWQFPSADVDSRVEVVSPVLTDAEPLATNARPADRTAQSSTTPERVDSFLNYARKKTNPHESQLRATTPLYSFGFNRSAVDLQKAEQLQEIGHLCAFSLELHARSRIGFIPDPAHDPICAVFYSVCKDSCRNGATQSGCIIVSNHLARAKNCRSTFGLIDWNTVVVVENESELLERTADIVVEHDPDILLGFDIQRFSWGYYLERAAALQLELCAKISRVPGSSRENRFNNEDHWWSLSEVHISGRIVLNLWRILRHEMALTSYTFSSVAYHLLHRRCPEYSFDQLTQWFDGDNVKLRRRVMEFYRLKVEMELLIISRCDILNRTAEMARLYGIQFYDVLSRGSQFRVESMMLRMTRKENYVAPSPSPVQRNRMAAPECIALTMEPESRLYTDPVLVLDFQSLYPSVVIAYNYCYSTCLGKISNMDHLPRMPLGCVGYDIPVKALKDIVAKREYHISPAGVAFVTSKVRRGILPRMLDEILNTRIMVKRRMSMYKNNPALTKLLDARQLALKLIANVTYGYTSANWSGRMPCVEIADSIVHKGRETLERTIRLVHNTPAWGGRVVYGDTDSLFVLLPGKTKDQAFDIGAQIAAAVTEANPSPVKLKFEKVFYPCLLETKKRYVGYSYESRDQVEPKFDAKGIETVRRDTCPAVVKILDRTLRLLFDHKGAIDPVRAYVTQQFSRILRGSVSVQDFIFAKEYRGRGAYRERASVPALSIARKRTERDPRAEPRSHERVQYVIVAGSPNATLISCVVEPHQLLANPSLRLNLPYYITGQIIPALNRALTLVSDRANALRWYKSMPKRMRINAWRPSEDSRPPPRGAQRTLSQFFASRHCALCGELTVRQLCNGCLEPARAGATAITLHHKAAVFEQRRAGVHRICLACTCETQVERIACISTDCPVFFQRIALQRDAPQIEAARRLIHTEF